MASRLLLNIIVLLFAFCLVLCGALLPSQLIYQFPLGSYLENIAVRKDGSILVTLVSSPEVYLIQPSANNPDPQLIHRFENYSSATGITETSPDTFEVAVTVAGDAGPVPGTGALWQIKFKGNQVKVTLTAKLPDVGLSNGLATLNKDKVFLSDSLNGIVVVVDLKTGISSLGITDPLLDTLSSKQGLKGARPGVNGIKIQGDTLSSRLGLPGGNGIKIRSLAIRDPLLDTLAGLSVVNGIKIRGDILYFTNSAQNLFGRIPIDRKTGKATGQATKIVNGLSPGQGYDDFALSKKGDVAYLSNMAGNFIERVDLATKQQIIVVGQIHSTEIAEPTSAAFGRNGRENTLFVTTAGGLYIPVNGNETTGAQLVAIKLGAR